MRRLLTAGALLGAGLLLAPSTRGASNDTPLQIADLAWERGDYVAALTDYLQLLDSPDANAVLEPIALQTGELFHTTELTADGAAPRFSPDGKHFAYETGLGARRTIRVFATADPSRPVAELRGGSVAF